ncbi:MAG TPA: GDSL-type esterase/lipase family protein [Pseudonocardiaceae bacterium]|jgi:lysophospholipase L1-like esterase|nr:GDSL-type esterase/lipase family protein [Pseudonocardiaceae bacterium]
MSGRSLLGLAIGALTLGLLAAGSIAPAAAATPAHSRAGYLALGDSVAFGYTPPETTPPLNYFNAANFVGYPEDFARATGLNLANASCPGETTASMIRVTAQSNGCENAVGSPFGYRTVYPLHVFYLGPQLAYAVGYLRTHPQTRLVTIDIGANDMFVCQQTTADTCTGSDFQAALNQVSANLATIYTALRGAGHYRGALMLVSYYSLDYADPAQNQSSQALNAALTAPTHRYGGVVADGYDAFRLVAARAGGDTCAAGLLVKLPDGTCNIHPSAFGHQVLAAAIGAALAHAAR